MEEIESEWESRRGRSFAINEKCPIQLSASQEAY